MNAKQAAEVLHVQLDGLTRDDVSSAFAALAKRAHPDTGERDDALLDNGKKARKVLTEFIEKGGAEPKIICGGCGGSGRTHGRFGSVACPRCGGKGHR